MSTKWHVPDWKGRSQPKKRFCLRLLFKKNNEKTSLSFQRGLVKLFIKLNIAVYQAGCSKFREIISASSMTLLVEPILVVLSTHTKVRNSMWYHVKHMIEGKKNKCAVAQPEIEKQYLIPCQSDRRCSKGCQKKFP